MPTGGRPDLDQALEIEATRLAAFDDGSLDVGREEGETEQLTHATPMQTLTCRKPIDVDNVTPLDRCAPPVRADKRVEKDPVDLRPGGRSVLFGPSFDALDPTPAPERAGDRDAHAVGRCHQDGVARQSGAQLLPAAVGSDGLFASLELDHQ